MKEARRKLTIATQGLDEIISSLKTARRLFRDLGTDAPSSGPGSTLYRTRVALDFALEHTTTAANLAEGIEVDDPEAQAAAILQDISEAAGDPMGTDAARRLVALYRAKHPEMLAVFHMLARS